jgi:soluble lytic murein transglycosylase-like protein
MRLISEADVILNAAPKIGASGMNKPTFRGLPPYGETRRYVARVLRYQREYRTQSSLA